MHDKLDDNFSKNFASKMASRLDKSFKVLMIVFILSTTAQGARNRGRHSSNNYSEDDEFSGDSYAEFVQKYYQNSRINVDPSRGGESFVDGSGDSDGFEDEDDTYDSSGFLPTNFGPYLTDDEDFYSSSHATSTSWQPSSPLTTTISTVTQTTTTASTIYIDGDVDELDAFNPQRNKPEVASFDNFDGSGSGDGEGDDDDEDSIENFVFPVSTTTQQTTATTLPTTYTTAITTITTQTSTSASTISSTTPPTLIVDITTSSFAPTPLPTKPATNDTRVREQTTTSTPPLSNTTTAGDPKQPSVLISNRILIIALYAALVLVLCLSILIALSLIIRWKSAYKLARTAEEGSNSDSASSDLPIIKRSSHKTGQIVARNSVSEKSHYARRTTPSSPPPLMPPDLSLDSNNFPSKRDSLLDPTQRRDSTSKRRISNDWY